MLSDSEASVSCFVRSFKTTESASKHSWLELANLGSSHGLVKGFMILVHDGRMS